jgi:hypothetical protein
MFNLKICTMSVIIIEMSEINGYRNQFINSTNLFATLNRLPVYHEVSKRFEHRSLKPVDMFKVVIDYTLWYCHVANVTAYNLQYQENVSFDFEAEFDGNMKPFEANENDDYYHYFGSLLYNMAANDGTVFMPESYRLLANAIYGSVEKASFFKNDVPLRVENKEPEIRANTSRNINLWGA